MLTIHQPKIRHARNKSRLYSEIEIDDEQKILWFEVDSEYEKYLCSERSDAFLVSALPYAMRKGHDITCSAPITDELLYNISQHLIPALSKYGKKVYHTLIVGTPSAEPIENFGAVGTGMSGGVGSFHAVLNHWRPYGLMPKLTHLCINNTGSFNTDYAQHNIPKAREDAIALAQKVADSLKLPLIITDSNICEVFDFDDYSHVHTYNSAFAILALQKLWGTYFYSSASRDYAAFSLEEHEAKDCAFYDLLTLNCLSTRRLRLYSEGAVRDRVEKTAAIADFPIAQKYLHVCTDKGQNCGLCDQCRQTMITLDTLDRLDPFKTFPIDYYRAHTGEYLLWLAKKKLEKDPETQLLYTQVQKGKHAKDFKKALTRLDKNAQVPEVHAQCVCIMDAKTGQVLLEKNADVKEIPAGITKILTCMVALEKGLLTEVVTMPKVAPKGNSSGVKPGEQMLLKDMLYGMMLLKSSNDLAEAVALNISGSTTVFVNEMNALAQRIGMKSSHFSSPTGIMHVSHYASARDIALLVRYALGNSVFRQIFATPTYTCNSSTSGHTFESNNALIHQKKGYRNRKYESCLGGQAGSTSGRYSFASVARKQGQEHIVVQLAITDNYGTDEGLVYRFVDAVALHEWAFR
ncbi:MAG: hypothetical protein FWG24_02410 [Eggerthellaceae bacterium]|nr:hypothetical protein [Eggerthellaceae bacterium]